jgi:hypothetical protein
MTNANDLINETRYKVDELVSESYPNHGLTKREYFAAMALQGLLAEQYWTSPENLARCSTEAADALINALNDKP